MEKRFEDKKIPEGMLKDDGKQKDAAATAAGNFYFKFENYQLLNYYEHRLIRFIKILTFFNSYNS